MPQPTKNLGIKSLKIPVLQNWLTNAKAMSLNPIMDTMDSKTNDNCGEQPQNYHKGSQS